MHLSPVPESRPAPRARVVRRGWTVAALAAAGALAGAAPACTDVPTDLATPVSIEFDTLTLPARAIVSGDTLRDAFGNVIQLRAVVRNVNAQVIEGAQVAFVIPDSAAANTLGVRIADGTIVATPVSPNVFDQSRSVRVAASVGNIQAQPLQLDVVRRPVALRRVGADSVATIQYNPADTTTGRSEPLQVRVLSREAPDTGVRSVRVVYSIVDSARGVVESVRLVDESGRDSSSVVTAGAGGEATRRLRVRLNAPGRDTVVVEARVYLRPGTSLEPVRFLVPVLRTAPATSR